MDIHRCKMCRFPHEGKASLLECGHILCEMCWNMSKVNGKCRLCDAAISAEKRNGITLTEKVLRTLSTKQSLSASIFVPYAETERSIRITKKRLHQYMSHSSNVVNMFFKLEKTFESTQASNVQTLLDVIDELNIQLKLIEHILDKEATFEVLNELKNFSRPEEFIQSLISRLERREKLFAVYRIGIDIKFGRLSVDQRRWKYKLFVHSLTETKIEEGASMISFQDIKDSIHSSNILTFIDVPNEKSDPTDYLRLIFSMNVNSLATQFIKICSGECNKTYKGVSFTTNFFFLLENEPILSVNGYMCDDMFQSKPIDYNFNLSGEPRFIKYLQIPDASSTPFYGPSNTTCHLLQASENGGFKLVKNSATKRFDNIIGVMNRGFLKQCYPVGSTLLDCGVGIAIKQYDMYKIVPSDILHEIPYANIVVDHESKNPTNA